MVSLLPVPEPPDPVEGALGHFEHTNWVKAALKALDAGTVHSVGGASGAMTIDGSLTVNPVASESADIILIGNAAKSLWGYAHGQPRWRAVMGDGTAEGGSDSGSWFALFPFTDAGVQKAATLKADRASNLLQVAAPPTSPLGVATKQYVDDAMPIGAIIAYGGSSAPTGWLICNGNPIPAQYTTLIGRVGANTPNLASRFIVGVGQGSGLSNYALGAASAAGVGESVKLKATESGLPVHAHAASTQAETATHTHSIDPPATATSTESTYHTHSGTTGFVDRMAQHAHSIREGITTGDSDYWIDTSDATPGGDQVVTNAIMPTNTDHKHPFTTGNNTPLHTHSVQIAPFTSGGRSVGHTHGVTVDSTVAADASLAHENRPPYYALLYIIKAL